MCIYRLLIDNMLVCNAHPSISHAMEAKASSESSTVSLLVSLLKGIPLKLRNTAANVLSVTDSQRFMSCFSLCTQIFSTAVQTDLAQKMCHSHQTIAYRHKSPFWNPPFPSQCNCITDLREGVFFLTEGGIPCHVQGSYGIIVYLNVFFNSHQKGYFSAQLILGYVIQVLICSLHIVLQWIEQVCTDIQILDNNVFLVEFAYGAIWTLVDDQAAPLGGMDTKRPIR